jgi:hypothetical protein
MINVTALSIIDFGTTEIITSLTPELLKQNPISMNESYKAGRVS